MTKKLAVVCVVLLIGLMPVPGFTLAPESRVGSEESAQASVAKGTGWDDKVAASIAGLGITGDATMGQALTSITNAKAQLGMKLFFTKGLGGDKDAACVTCHHPKLGGGDNLSLPIGVTAEIPDLLGPGRPPVSG